MAEQQDVLNVLKLIGFIHLQEHIVENTKEKLDKDTNVLKDSRLLYNDKFKEIWGDNA